MSMPMSIFLSLALRLSSFAVLAQEVPGRVEIENELVHVARWYASPHEVVPMREAPPALLVFLSDHSLRFTFAGQKSAELRGKAGQFFWHPGGRSGLENLSDHRIEAIRVVPKFKPQAVELPPVKVEFENELIRVRRVRLAPRHKGPMHKANPGVFIYLTTARWRFTHSDGSIKELNAKAGDVSWDPGGNFATESLIDEPIELVRIGLKTAVPGSN